MALLGHKELINSLGPSDTIWRHIAGSTLAQVMACCLTAPSHYLNQCWLIISKVQWHPSQSNFTRNTSAISHWNYLENYLSKILFKSPRGQWVNRYHITSHGNFHDWDDWMCRCLLKSYYGWWYMIWSHIYCCIACHCESLGSTQPRIPGTWQCMDVEQHGEWTCAMGSFITGAYGCDISTHKLLLSRG